MAICCRKCNTSVALSWTALAGAKSYEIRTFARGAYTGTVMGAIKYNGSNQASVNVTELTAGTDYTFAIRALCNVGNPSKLASLDASTSGGNTPPATPTTNSLDLGNVGNKAPGDSITFTGISYSTTENRDILVEVRNPQNQWLGIKRTAVNTGSATINVTVNVNATIGNGYKVTAMLVQKGGNWQTQVTNSSKNFNVTAGGSAKQLGEDSLSVNVYPNPASDIVNVDADNVSSLRVRNLSGQTILANTNQSSINISGLANGVYILETSIENKVTTTKIVKK